MYSKKQMLEFHTLHRKALKISLKLQKQEYLMIEILQRIDQDKVYRFLDFKSLFQYAVVGLKLSENRAYSFIVVARKAKNIVKFQEALKKGEITLSKAKRISSVIDEKNFEKWLNLAKSLSQRSLERAVAKENPNTLVQEGSHFVSENTLEFKAAISLDTDKLIRRVQDLLSASLRRPATLEEVLREMAKLYVDKKDPVVKAARVLRDEIKTEIKNGVKKEGEKDSPLRQVNREPLSQTLKHQVNLRDQGQCQELDPHKEGEICGDSRWTDVHHKIPVSQGGQNILENLITLCKAHHQMEHDWDHFHL